MTETDDWTTGNHPGKEHHPIQSGYDRQADCSTKVHPAMPGQPCRRGRIKWTNNTA
jgi:hypothetical protein